MGEEVGTLRLRCFGDLLKSVHCVTQCVARKGGISRGKSAPGAGESSDAFKVAGEALGSLLP